MIPLGADRMTMRPSAPWGGRRRGAPRRPLAVTEGKDEPWEDVGSTKLGWKKQGKTWKVCEKHGKSVNSEDFSRIFNEFG